MARLRAVLGFLFALGVGVLLYLGWFWVHRDIRGTPFQDFQILAGVLFVFVVLWIAEKIWDQLAALLNGER